MYMYVQLNYFWPISCCIAIISPCLLAICLLFLSISLLIRSTILPKTNTLPTSLSTFSSVRFSISFFSRVFDAMAPNFRFSDAQLKKAPSNPWETVVKSDVSACVLTFRLALQNNLRIASAIAVDCGVSSVEIYDVIEWRACAYQFPAHSHLLHFDQSNILLRKKQTSEFKSVICGFGWT